MSLKKSNLKFFFITFSLFIALSLLYSIATPVKAAQDLTYTHKQLYIGTDPSSPLYEMYVWVKTDDASLPAGWVRNENGNIKYNLVEDTTGGLVTLDDYFGEYCIPEETDCNIKISSGLPAGDYSIKAQADVGGAVQTVIIPITVINAPHVALSAPGDTVTVSMPAGVTVFDTQEEGYRSNLINSIPVENTDEYGWRQEQDGISGSVSGSSETGQTVQLRYDSHMNENFTYAYSDPNYADAQKASNFYGIIAGVSLNGAAPTPGPSPSQPSAPINPDEKQVVYRLFNANNGEHLYTTSALEYQTLADNGWTGEGKAWKYPETGEAVIRLYHPGAGIHHYTKDMNEVDVLTSTGGWVKDFEGQPVFYSGGDVPIYRLNANGNHLWTTDENEYNVLAGQGWQQEGVGFYGQPNS